jgi:RNA polymerase sigma factor (sigma-70 family)
MTLISKEFKRRLAAGDEQAWRELDRDFGRFITAGIKCVGQASPLTVQDLKQEVLATLVDSIAKFDTRRGTSFSAWLYTFGRMAAQNYRSKYMAQRRGGGHRPEPLEDAAAETRHDPEFAEFEREVFRAKVMRAVRRVEGLVPLLEFQCYYLKVASGRNGSEIATKLAVSGATVSRHQTKLRAMMRAEISAAVEAFSWEETEVRELSARGLDRDDYLAFDDALSDVLRVNRRARGGRPVTTGPAAQGAAKL